MAHPSSPVIIRQLGQQDYEAVWRKMLEFTQQRNTDTASEIWLIEHPPVFTQGQAGKPEHLLNPGNIPVVQTDRGGQVTYHGPGQAVFYTLLNLHQIGIGVRTLVQTLENAVIEFLADFDIYATSRRDAPGVYVNDRKIAALGLRVKKGCTYHGLSFNVNMDLQPFERINPCGYAGLQVTQTSDLGIDLDTSEVSLAVLQKLLGKLNLQMTIENELTN